MSQTATLERPATPTRGEPLLSVRNLRTRFYTADGIVKAVDGVSFDLYPGQTLGIVGESGCGKSVTALSIMRLIPNPPGRITDGQIVFEGQDVIRMSDDQIRRVRGNKIAMIFQDPMTSLNPVLTINRQISEALQLHLGMDGRAARKRSIELLDLVGIPSAKARVDDYPHQFSGGMRQRVMIAMALSCNPKLLIADEPTTALDVTIQAQILDLIKSLSKEFGTATILITHDLGVVAGMCDDIMVMYAGRVAERSTVYDLYADPSHPYTMGLLRSVPRLDETRKERLVPIDGLPPDLIELPDVCPFHPRCIYAADKCRAEMPPLVEVAANGHQAACWFPRGEGR
ncbi:MAG TPA: ABC transporter ATP-binding protein [Chloroflexota bacterium]|nr:ABC transporter ATP-binding protein [Chloroflexota bacterium]